MSIEIILLGAGASVDAGIPTTFGLTKKVVDKFVDIEDIDTKALNFVISGLQFRKGIQNEYIFSNINIEEVLRALEMLSDRFELEIAPFVGQWHPYIEKLENQINTRNVESELSHAVYSSERLERSSFHGLIGKLSEIFANLNSSRSELFNEVYYRVIDTMKNMLWLKDNSNIEYLLPLVKYVNENNITLVSLNYDNTIELASEKSKIPCNNGLDVWLNHGKFTKPDKGIEFLKLHGSMNWAEERIGPQGNIWEKVVKEVSDIYSQKFYKPALVIGTGNKLTASGPFLDLIYTFKERLKDANSLITIGYSFSDEHINSIIINWLNGSDQRTIDIIDAPEKNCKEHSFYMENKHELKERMSFAPVGTKNWINENI